MSHHLRWLPNLRLRVANPIFDTENLVDSERVCFLEKKIFMHLSFLFNGIPFDKGAKRPGTGCRAGTNDKSRFRRTCVCTAGCAFLVIQL